MTVWRERVASQSTNGCGIVIADHTDVGVWGNLVKGNTSDDNSPNGYGAGILIASPAPDGGIVRDNLIVDNEAHGNGLSGFLVHKHYAGGDFSGNQVIGNRFGRNNVTPGSSGGAPAGDYMDPHTTGIYLGSADALSIVVTHNSISHDEVGIFTAGPVTVLGNHNTFRDVGTPTASTPTYAG